MKENVTAMLSEKQVEGNSLDEEIKRGIAASEAGNKAEAEAIFRQVVAEHPDALEAWIWLGWTSANLDDSDQAFSRAAELDPRNEEAQLGLRWVASQRGAAPAEGQPEAEVPEMSVMPEMPLPSTEDSVGEAMPEPTAEDWDFDAAMKQAVSTARHGDKPSAYAMFRNIAERNPNSADVWVWYGGTSPQLEDAETAFKRALEIDPLNEEARLGLRWVALRRKVIERTGPLAAPEKDKAKAGKPKKVSFFAALLKKLNITLPVLLMIVAVVVVWGVVAFWYLAGSR